MLLLILVLLCTHSLRTASIENVDISLHVSREPPATWAKLGGSQIFTLRRYPHSIFFGLISTSRRLASSVMWCCPLRFLSSRPWVAIVRFSFVAQGAFSLQTRRHKWRLSRQKCVNLFSTHPSFDALLILVLLCTHSSLQILSVENVDISLHVSSTCYWAKLGGSPIFTVGTSILFFFLCHLPKQSAAIEFLAK